MPIEDQTERITWKIRTVALKSISLFGFTRNNTTTTKITSTKRYLLLDKNFHRTHAQKHEKNTLLSIRVKHERITVVVKLCTHEVDTANEQAILIIHTRLSLFSVKMALLVLIVFLPLSHETHL